MGLVLEGHKKAVLCSLNVNLIKKREPLAGVRVGLQAGSSLNMLKIPSNARRVWILIRLADRMPAIGTFHAFWMWLFVWTCTNLFWPTDGYIVSLERSFCTCIWYQLDVNWIWSLFIQPAADSWKVLNFLQWQYQVLGISAVKYRFMLQYMWAVQQNYHMTSYMWYPKRNKLPLIQCSWKSSDMLDISDSLGQINVWWDISQIWIECVKLTRQMSDEPWKFFRYTADWGLMMPTFSVLPNHRFTLPRWVKSCFGWVKNSVII